jgi:hypothetical protein
VPLYRDDAVVLRVHKLGEADFSITKRRVSDVASGSAAALSSNLDTAAFGHKVAVHGSTIGRTTGEIAGSSPGLGI